VLAVRQKTQREAGMPGGGSSLIFATDQYPQLAARLREEYSGAWPFPHVVIDDFLPPEVADRVLEEFPGPGDIDWIRFRHGGALKLGSRHELQFPPFVRDLLYQFNSSVFLQFLESLTGIRGLVTDPYFEGGGLHQIERDGFVKIHADFNIHPQLRLDRRINLLLYLNKDWKEEYGGHLELWNPAMSRCEKRILPVFNRCVIFSISDRAFHGHPEPLTCPEGMSRKSLALFYYTNGRPADERSAAHSSLYQYRPGEVPLAHRVSRASRRLLHRVFSRLAERTRPPLS
jgi:hypothetical protein